ncbi:MULTISPECIES: prepilin peptidase [Arsenicicoccus]|uniref:prepilin peptidase n=1 Tax=Arsenicicoccus TaxID=267408 RepID=UPI00257B4DE3|nr:MULTISPECIES: prepilin peptidase [Arsenicicoccus]
MQGSGTVLVAVLGLLVGHRLDAWLRAGTYRRDRDLVRRPRASRWVRPASVALPALAWWQLCAHDRAPLAVVVVPLAWLMVALAAIDLDVHRLPDALQLPLYPVLAVALTAVAAVTRDGGEALLRSAVAVVVVLLVGGLLWLTAPRQGLGLGDVKLAGLLAAVLAQLGWSQVLLGLWAGFALGGVVAAALLVTRRAGRRDHLALGPPLMLGALLAVLAG